MDTIILGDGPLGAAIATAFRERGTEALLLGRPRGRAQDRTDLGTPDLVIEASRSDAVADNIAAALAAGCRRFVIATTAWDTHRAAVEADLRAHGAAAVAAPNLSIGAALFFRLVDRASELMGAIDDFEPYLLEWHRRMKQDRPSGTARELVRRIEAASRWNGDELEIAVIRAGASPGMHLVGFDSPGETIELRLTARDRSAYAAGALAAADWLSRTARSAGIHQFDEVVDELLAAPALAATA
jgi:4-hydroxy-tetrahydrodipicolinate reductase